MGSKLGGRKKHRVRSEAAFAGLPGGKSEPKVIAWHCIPNDCFLGFGGTDESIISSQCIPKDSFFSFGGSDSGVPATESSETAEKVAMEAGVPRMIAVKNGKNRVLVAKMSLTTISFATKSRKTMN